MIRRDKLIAIVVGTLVGGTILYIAVNGLCLSPASQLDAQTRERLNKVAQLKKSIAANSDSRRKLAAFAAGTLGTESEANKVSSILETRLTEILKQVGLTSPTVAGSPPLDSVRPTALPKKAGAQLGWRISAKGRLDQVLELLYYLDAEPYLHKVEQLSITPAGNEVKVDVTFLTLVLPEIKDASLRAVTTMPAATQPASLEERKIAYALIAARDVLRPYIQRVVQPQPNDPPPGQHEVTPDTLPADPTARLKLSDMSIYNGQDDQVGFYDLTTPDKVQWMKIGDAMAGGKIVCIDRRPLPKREKPELDSPGRIIIQIGQEYFAVEVETTVAQKYPLPADKLPTGLKK